MRLQALSTEGYSYSRFTLAWYGLDEWRTISTDTGMYYQNVSTITADFWSLLIR